MAPTKYLVADPATGRLQQQSGNATYVGPAGAGRLVALADNGKIDPELIDLTDGVLPPGGTEGQVLTIVAGEVAWADAQTGAGTGEFFNPMDAYGDMIIGSGSEYTNEALLSLGATASDSATYQNFFASYAIDGDENTNWFGSSSFSAYLQIDLQTPQAITGWRLNQSGNDWRRRFVVESSPDGTTWTVQSDAYNSGSPPIDTGIIPLASAVTARYWRFRADGTSLAGNGYGWGIRTAGLYSGGTAGTPTRLPIGDESDVLTVEDGIPTWKPAPLPPALLIYMAENFR
ncbi:hypothetical protein SE17_19185 [Kouleothrix aurantiaca]|uniref:F5/8 type C domain-containing protein n=1 Tax=Kouleothrix aurantiaca TaxID=186479 RepID=A0A0N8PS57_9CHLR|nr:hypothetical protein SE17_19185 [Kouleothrix aurantiaca]